MSDTASRLRILLQIGTHVERPEPIEMPSLGTHKCGILHLAMAAPDNLNVFSVLPHLFDDNTFFFAFRVVNRRAQEHSTRNHGRR